MFRLSIAIALLVVAGVKTAGAGLIFDGHEYEVVLRQSGATWNGARGDAQGLGAGWDLAAITSAAEHDFVTSLLGTAYGERAHFWLAGTDLGTEGSWRWETGEPFGYTNWWPGEPNNAGDEHHLAYDLRLADGTLRWAWNDLSSEAAHWVQGFVAERVAPLDADVPEPASMFLLGLGALVIARRRVTLA
jgi:hypothetical protein